MRVLARPGPPSHLVPDGRGQRDRRLLVAVRHGRASADHALDEYASLAETITSGRPAWRPLFDHFDGDKVIWADGSIDRVDAILLATGFRTETEHLATLTGPDGRCAVAVDGTPAHHYGVSTTVPGLGFVGLEWQRGFASATLRGVGPDAARVVAEIRNRR